MRAMRTRTLRKASRMPRRKTTADDRQHRHDEERHQREARLDQEEHHREADHLRDVGHQRDDPGGEHLGDVLDVVGRARHEPADGIAVEEAEVQPLEVGEDVAAQVAHRRLPRQRHQHAVPVLERRADQHRHEVERREPERAAHAEVRLEEERERAARGGLGGALPQHLVEPVLHDPGRRELEQEERHHEPDRQRDLPPVRRDVAPEPPEEPGVVGLAEGLLLLDPPDTPALTPAPPRAPTLRSSSSCSCASRA